MILLLIPFIKSILTPFLFKDFNGRIISLLRFFKSSTNALAGISLFIESTSVELRITRNQLILCALSKEGSELEGNTPNYAKVTKAKPK